MYYTYMLRCIDGSLYTGITTNPERRFKEHSAGTDPGAKYTRSHPPVSIAAVWGSDSRSSASALEYRIKRLKKRRKEMLADNPDLLFDLLGDKIDSSQYITITDKF